uniref:Uncharacterized protein n=1 Tax=Anguilla anguilla TaxID=7936 RepID=A0A0E9UVB9_ANGAN
MGQCAKVPLALQ